METVIFTFETKRRASDADAKRIAETVRKETGQDLKITADGKLLVFGNGSEFIEHIALDVGESAAKAELGAADENKKSELIMVGGSDYSVQPCFDLSEKFDNRTIKEIERLYKFVTGIDGVGYFNENRFYIDTKAPLIKHSDMDVAEILVRRMIDGKGISVKAQGFKALPRKGRSGAQTSASSLFETRASGLADLLSNP